MLRRKTRRNRRKTVGGNKLHVTHNAGFFSCCSVRLHDIIGYFNTHKSLPADVNSSKQFQIYKNGDKQRNITFDYFEDYKDKEDIKYEKHVNYDHDKQFTNYKELDYKAICPFVRKYFKPSKTIQDIIETIEKKYIKTDFSNICTMFYRGNDKNTETTLPSHESYIEKANKILEKNPNVQFLIQSDETEFIEKMTATFPNNSFYFKDEIRHMTKRKNTVNSVFRNKNMDFSKKFLAITVIMSKTKHIICNAGNCSIWIMLYRENADNVHEFLNGSWL